MGNLKIKNATRQELQAYTRLARVMIKKQEISQGRLNFIYIIFVKTRVLNTWEIYSEPDGSDGWHWWLIRLLVLPLSAFYQHIGQKGAAQPPPPPPPQQHPNPTKKKKSLQICISLFFFFFLYRGKKESSTV